MARRGLLLLGVGVVLAVVGNLLQARVVAGVEDGAVAVERIGTTVRVEPRGQALGIFLGPAPRAGDPVLRRVDCGASTPVRRPTGSPRTRLTRFGDYSLFARVDATDDPFEVRCDTRDAGLQAVSVVVSPGGTGMRLVSWLSVGGIVIAALGAGLLLVAVLTRVRRPRRQAAP